MLKLILCTVMFVASIITTSGQNFEDNLLIYYPFNNSSQDLSGNDFHGIENGVQYSLGPGIDNNTALQLDGSSWVTIPQDSDLETELPVSLSFWIKIDQYSPSILTTDDADNVHTGVWFSTAAVDGTNAIGVSYGDGGTTTGSSRRTFLSDTTLSTDTWYHVVAVVRDALDMELWIDCNLITGEYNGSGGGLAYSLSGGAIGRKDAHTQQPPYYFYGAIDEFYLFDRELTAFDIERLCDPDFVPEVATNLDENTEKLDECSFDVNSNIVLCKDKGLLRVYDLQGRVLQEESVNAGERVELKSAGLVFVLFESSACALSRKMFVN